MIAQVMCWQCMLEAISWCTGDTSDSSGNELAMYVGGNQLVYWGRWRQSVGVLGTPVIALVMCWQCMLEAISWCTGDTSDSSGNVLAMYVGGNQLVYWGHQ